MRVQVLETLLIVALGLGVAGYYSFRKIRGMRVEDERAEKLLSEIAHELAKALPATAEEIASALAVLKPNQQSVATPSSLRVKCTFRKISPAMINFTVQADYAGDGKPTITTLAREISWDDVPRDVRREFIRTGEKELHYALGESVQERATNG
jgi:hypothetical protein